MPHFGEVRVDARAPDLPPRVAVPEVQGEVACQGREEEGEDVESFRIIRSLLLE